MNFTTYYNFTSDYELYLINETESNTFSNITKNNEKSFRNKGFPLGIVIIFTMICLPIVIIISINLFSLLLLHL